MVDNVRVYGRAEAEAVGFDDEGVFVEFKAVVKVALGGFEFVEGDVSGLLDGWVHGLGLFGKLSG